MSRTVASCAIAFVVLSLLSIVNATEPNDGYSSLFNGKTLAGWHFAPKDASRDWSVEGGTIIGEGSANRLSYLVYDDTQLTDFDLRLEYRLRGKGNTGIEIRSQVDTSGKRPFEGYHADLGHVGIGPHILGAWDFHFARRKEHACPRGTRLMISADETATAEKIDRAVQLGDIGDDDWNEVRIIAQRNHFQFFINDKLSSEFTDGAKSGTLDRGAIALQIHDKGMRVEFRNIRLKKLTEERANECAAPPVMPPVKVFILAGQSNMEGQGVVDFDHEQNYNGGKGNLEYVMQHSPLAERYQHLKDADGNWVVRNDVSIRFQTEREGLKKGGLGIGYTSYGGMHHIGPELQIGHRLGNHLDEPVLLVKTAWGGKSLYKDFRPPSAGGEVGPYYTRMIREVREALASRTKEFPATADREHEIAGFIWFQGWNDMFDDDARGQYQQNLVHLVHDVRAEFDRPQLPVVIGELGNGGADAGKSMLELRAAQAAAAKELAREGNLRFVKTTRFARPKEESPNVGHGHHWFGNAESYFLIGDALGGAMVELVE